MKETLKYIKNNNLGKVIENMSFKKLTTYKIGGIARIVFYPKTAMALIKSLKYFKNNNISFKVWGRGSNIIPSDDNYNGVIIKLDSLNKINIKSRYAIVGAGVSLMQLANQLCKEGYSGLEFACGIPGSVGGAVYMNAGAYNSSIGDVILSIKVLDNDFDIIELSKRELLFGYRSSILQSNKEYICIEAKIRIIHGDKEVIKNLISERKKRREETQPLSYPSAGSVFRNPEGMYAGKLIEDSNLKGYRIGGAKISDKHANFIINYKNARASDVKKLLMLAKDTVKKNYDVDLKIEQEFFNWE